MKHLEQSNLLHFQKDWIQVTENADRIMGRTLVIQVRGYWGYGHGNTRNTGITV